MSKNEETELSRRSVRYKEKRTFGGLFLTYIYILCLVIDVLLFWVFLL